MSLNVIENCVSITFLVNSILLHNFDLNQQITTMPGEGGVLSFFFFLKGGGGCFFPWGGDRGSFGLLLPVFCIHNFGEMAHKPRRKSLQQCFFTKGEHIA